MLLLLLLLPLKLHWLQLELSQSSLPDLSLGELQQLEKLLGVDLQVVLVHEVTHRVTHEVIAQVDLLPSLGFVT